MPPFKASRIRSAQDDEIDRLIATASPKLVAALDKWRRATWAGVTAENVNNVLARLSAPDVWQPFEDAIIAIVQELAVAGVSFGQAVVEREVFGVTKRTPPAFDWQLANDAAAEWAVQYGRTLAGELLKTTNQRIQGEVSRWIQNSEPIGNLIDRIRGGFLYSESRADAIAVTEVTRAFARGNQEAWRAAGIIEGNRWNTNADELVCPICQPLNGRAVRIGESFDLGITGPPAHVRCRCWLTPVVMIDEGAIV